MKDIKKYQGCLLGGAVGDAFGYPVEFLEEGLIFEFYGESGITEYNLVNGVAQITDDTQMTLFTANGLLLPATRNNTAEGIEKYTECISFCYMDWLKTQAAESFGFEMPSYSWLNYEPDMNHSRDPGKACISALMSGKKGSIEFPINNSKGCGGVMRVAPIGLFFCDDEMTIDEIDMLGAQAAALTHGHDLGYIPAAALVHIINKLAHEEGITLEDAVIDSISKMKELFPKAEHLADFTNLMEEAIELSKKDLGDLEGVKKLGFGWVAEETLAIAVYCALKYEKDFEKAIIASVNHSGDSDSTGAITGSILGTYLGVDGIPQKFLKDLELKDVIETMAKDLFNKTLTR